MIRKETWKTKIPADTATTIAASKKPGTTYDAQKGELSFNVNIGTRDAEGGK